MKLSDFLRGVGQPMPYYPSLAKLVGVKECVLICRFVWWHGMQADSEGWIYKTRDDLTEETGLSHEEQATARKALRTLGLLEERKERLRHKHFYRVKFEALDALWEGREAGNAGVPTPGTTASATPGTTASCNTTKETQKRQSSAPSAAASNPSAHAVFVKAWADAYLEAFGDPYIFSGGKDGAAVKRLLNSGMTPDDLLAIARQAWTHGKQFNCKQAASIAGFASRLNDIRAELRGQQPRKDSPLAGWEDEVNAPL
jgi:hypothetical protein